MHLRLPETTYAAGHFVLTQRSRLRRPLRTGVAGVPVGLGVLRVRYTLLQANDLTRQLLSFGFSDSSAGGG